MKTSSLFVVGLAFAILSIAPASAAKNAPNNNNAPNTNNECSSTTWPAAPAVPCHSPKFKPASYTECTEAVRKAAWDPSVAWWYCSNQGYKN
jgi:hypothetical protein